MHRLWRLRAGLPGVGNFCARRSAGKVEGIYRDQREVLRTVVFSLEGSGRPFAFPLDALFCRQLRAASFEQPGTRPFANRRVAPPATRFWLARSPTSTFHPSRRPLQSLITLLGFHGAEGVGGDRSAHLSVARIGPTGYALHPA